MKLPYFFQQLSSAKFFYKFSSRLLPWLTFLTLGFFIYRVIGGLIIAPPDYQQGDAFRIIYIHVPSAFLSMLVYMVMALAAAVALIWRVKLAECVVITSAKLGAWFTFLALVTGALWGKPMWGTWWIWDARLTSELILLFLYLGLIALHSAIESNQAKARAVNILVLVGVVNIPIIHYSVYWWSTLHQGATLSKFAKPAIAPDMLYPLLGMIMAFLFYYFTLLLLKVRTELLWRERKSQWVREYVKVEG